MFYEKNKNIEYLLNRSYYIFTLELFYDWLIDIKPSNDLLLESEKWFLELSINHMIKNLDLRKDTIDFYEELIIYFNSLLEIFNYYSNKEKSPKDKSRIKKLESNLKKIIEIDRLKGNIYLNKEFNNEK